MENIIKKISFIIVLLGCIQIFLAIASYTNNYVFLISTGLIVMGAGIFNLVALKKGVTKLMGYTAIALNMFNCILFCVELEIFYQPLVFIGIGMFLTTTVSFTFQLIFKAHYNNR